MESRIMKIFRGIASVPHVSFQEKKLSDAIYKLAKDLNLEAFQDEHNNLLIIKEASKGYEGAPTVMLQSHLDMVGEKNMDSDHNFDTDPLELRIEEGILFANNTTLGADNGVGIAYMIAILEDESLKHPRLECVFTVEEEVGLLGAAKFDASSMEASLCIGLDSSGENEACVSSSGGVRGHMVKTLSFEDHESDTIKIEIRGLLGGHSGEDISKERANALRLTGIILKNAIEDGLDVRVVDVQGGLKVNAICREANFELAASDVNGFKEWFKIIESNLKDQYKISDPNLSFNLIESNTRRRTSLKDTMGIANALFMLPYGVLQRSMEIEGLVITSANIGTANIIDNEFIINVSLRATQSFVIENVMHRVKLISKNTGYEVTFNAKYPGWSYDKDSKFRKRLFDVYKELRNEDMQEVATHGGLELGIWKDKMPKLDIIGMGPIMYDIHTPQERLDIGSFERTYEILLELLETLNNY